MARGGSRLAQAVRPRAEVDGVSFSLRRATVAHLWWRSLGETDPPPLDVQELFAAMLTAYVAEKGDADDRRDESKDDNEDVLTESRVRRLFSPKAAKEHAAKQGVDSIGWIRNALMQGAAITYTTKNVRNWVKDGWLSTVMKNGKTDEKCWGGRPTRDWPEALEDALRSLTRLPGQSWARVLEREAKLVEELRTDPPSGTAAASEDESQRDEERLHALKEALRGVAKAFFEVDSGALTACLERSTQIRQEFHQRLLAAGADDAEQARRAKVSRRAEELVARHDQEIARRSKERQERFDSAYPPHQNASQASSPARPSSKPTRRRR